MSAASAIRDDRARELLGTATIGYHIDAAWNVKLELFIGQTPIFLQVSEGERGSATLQIEGGEELDLERLRIDADADRLVFLALLLGHQLQRDESGCSTGQGCEGGRVVTREV